MSENKKYVAWLDLVRVISIVLVIVIHASGPLFSDWNLPTPVWMVGNEIISFVRVSVPLMFMISGYLLLSRQEDIRSFYGGRVRKVVVPLLVWSVIYLLWSKSGYRNYTMINAVKAMTLQILKGPAYYHFWFVYTLLAIYLFVPVLRVFVHAANETTIRYFALIWFIFGPLLDVIQQRFLGFNLGINLGFFTDFIGYFYLGYVFGRFTYSRRISNLAGIVYLLLGVFTILITAFWSGRTNHYFDFYHNYLRINIVIMSVCAFIWLKRLGENLSARFGEKIERPLRHLSSTTFGIYLVHVMILTTITRGVFGFRFNHLTLAPFPSVVLLTLMVLVASYIVTVILQKIPFVRAIVPA